MLFQLAVSFAGLFYLILGLVYTRKLLKEFNLQDRVVYLCLLFTLFGTNLFYYATIEPSMSHTYSFALAALFLYYVKKFSDGYQRKYLVAASVLIGLIILVRPTNALILLLVPFIAGGFTKEFWLGGIKPNLLPALLIPLLVLSTQMLMWYAETGHFIVWSYSDERFYFNHPHFFDVLFSYRKGWYVYCPLMFIATLGGLFSLFKTDRTRFYSFFLFFIPTVYILSSWWFWIYGDSFGMRIFIDFYPLFALMLGWFLASISKPIKQVMIVLCLLCIPLNLLQIYQYHNMILSHDSMSKSRYWETFLRTDAKYRGIYYTHNLHDLAFYDKLTYTRDYEHNGWDNDYNISTAFARSGVHSAIVDDKHLYGPTLVIKAADLPIGDDIYASINIWTYSMDTNNEATFIISTESPDGTNTGFNNLPLKNRVANQWEQTSGAVQIPPIRGPRDVIKIYAVFNKGRIYMDDLTIKLGHPN
jgi:hypothetical protein